MSHRCSDVEDRFHRAVAPSRVFLAFGLAVLLLCSAGLVHAQAPDALLQQIDERMAELAKLEAQLATGADGVVDEETLREQIAGERTSIQQELEALEESVLEAEARGETAPQRARVEALFGSWVDEWKREIAERSSQLSALRKQRATASDDEAVGLDEEIIEQSGGLVAAYEGFADHLARMDALGLAVASERAALRGELDVLAKAVSAAVPRRVEEVDAARARLSESPDDAALKGDVALAEKKLDRGTDALQTMADLLDELGEDTSRYRQVLIQTTGEITTDLLSRDVAFGLLQGWTARVREAVVENGPGLVFKVLVFIAILAVFRMLSNVTRRMVERAVANSKLRLSQLARSMIVTVAARSVFLLGFLVALSQLGIALGPLLAGLGVAGFIVGFALQDTLGNFAAGAMILVYRPFDVGDMIEAAGVFGKVHNMSLVSTTILTVDNQTLVVPNSAIWGNVIKNVTAQEVRRVDLVFGIGYSDDIPRAEKVLESILADHPKVLDDPEPVVKLYNLGDSSVDFVVRPWCNTGDYWEVHWDVTREVKMRFDAEGIGIPFPQRDVHFYHEPTADE